MIAYVICFGLTILLTYFSERLLKNKKKNKGIAILVIAMIIPAFFAGIRDVGVGRDINAYVQPVLEIALNNNFNGYWNHYRVAEVERGYDLFVYIFSLFSSNLNLLLFLLQLIPCSIVFYFAYSVRKEVPMFMVIIVYLLTWYCRSYTIMRQSISVALILLSIIMFKRKKILQTVLLFVLALTFHMSAVIAIGIYIIIIVDERLKINIKNKIFIYVLMFVTLLLMVISYEKVLYIFTYKIAILPEKFYNYLSNSQYALDDIAINHAESLFRIMWIFMGLLGVLIIKDNKHNYTQSYLCILIEALLFIISFTITNASRLGYYYIYIGILYFVPSLSKIFKKDKLNQQIAYISLISILLVFWIYKYPIKKNCETYPYKSSIIRWLK